MTPTREHGSLGSNIKIHFAGAEAYDRFIFAHDAGVNYFLFTVLPFIMDQFGIKWGQVTTCKNVKAYNKVPYMAKHTIMDSGLFSLMFGACKDICPDEKFIRRYKDAIVEFVKNNKLYNVTCVECDVQKLLGAQLAWELRKEFRDQLPNNRIINVFHFEDGKDGLDSLIDFSEYIAISVPELRIIKPKTYKEDVLRLASYIKNKKPNIDIHLLGCTELKMLETCKFCTSADSTSWVCVNRYGRVLGKHISTIKKEKFDEIELRSKKLLESIGVVPTEKLIKYFSNYWISAHLLKIEYEKIAGDQN